MTTKAREIVERLRIIRREASLNADEVAAIDLAIEALAAAPDHQAETPSDDALTTAEVRDHFAYGCGPEHTWEESRRAFDRWLAARPVVDDAAVVDALTAFYGEERDGWSMKKVRRMRAALAALGGDR